MQDTPQRFIAAAWAIVTTYLCVVAAQSSTPQGTASVTGRVTLDGRPVATMTVLLVAQPKEDQNFLQGAMEAAEPRKASTDSEGRFRFGDVAAGVYEVKVFAPTLVADKSESSFHVSEGQTVEGVDFALKTGGVVTGAVMLPDGRPAIRLSVHLNSIPPPKEARPISPEGNPAGGTPFLSSTTDDRGIYRIYGVAPGDYFVSANSSGNRKESVQTYYPGVTDKTRAGTVKVKATSETSSVDFKLGLSKKKGYEVRGRVVDESGKPVSGVMISCSVAREENGDGKAEVPSFPASGPIHSNAQGEFKIQGVSPGKYNATVMSMFDEAAVYSDPTAFEVGSRDVDGVEIKTHKGLTASGVAVIEGNDDPSVAAQLAQVQLLGTIIRSSGTFGYSVSRANLGADGSFVMTGLSPGKLSLMVSPLLQDNRFSILRVERGGAAQSEGIEITPGSPVTDIRLVLGYGNCTIFGRVAVEGGTLPKGSSLYVYIQRSGSEAAQSEMYLSDMGMGRSAVMRRIQVSPGDEFRAEGLAPGDYEVTITTSRYGGPRGADQSKSGSQRVTLSNGAQSEVNLTMNLSSDK
jgi:hypothetical protein